MLNKQQRKIQAAKQRDKKILSTTLKRNYLKVQMVLIKLLLLFH